MKNNYAFLKGRVKNAQGKEIDFRKTVFKEAVDEGVFDGDDIFALLKKVNGKWKHVEHAIGPTDVVYVCLANQYQASKELFDANNDYDY